MVVDDWNSRDRQGQVQLSHGPRLYLKASGPPRRQANAPAVVLVHGLGGTASEWLEVQRYVSRFARVYLYERAGYQGSDTSAIDPTCASIAAHLQSLLQAAGVEPPYLLVGHSYGGVIARQFLADDPTLVCGMVLVDSVPVVARFPEVWTKLLGNATYADVVGLRDNLGISTEQYRIIDRESQLNEGVGGIAEKELKHMSPGNQRLDDSLRGKQALGQNRLCVIFCDESNDFRKVYEYGVLHGHGTAEEQETVRQHLESMSADDEAAQRTQLALSGATRFIRAEGSRATHNVHMVDPCWVARQVQWVIDGTI